MAIYSGFTHQKQWFFIVMLVYQRVNDNIHSPAVFFSYLRLAIRKSEESPSNFGVKMCTQLYPTFEYIFLNVPQTHLIKQSSLNIPQSSTAWVAMDLQIWMNWSFNQSECSFAKVTLWFQKRFDPSVKTSNWSGILQDSMRCVNLNH